jgi:hypothetical protein
MTPLVPLASKGPLSWCSHYAFVGRLRLARGLPMRAPGPTSGL